MNDDLSLRRILQLPASLRRRSSASQGNLDYSGQLSSCDSVGKASGSEVVDVISPITEELFGRVPDSTPADIDRAFDADIEPWSLSHMGDRPNDAPPRNKVEANHVIAWGGAMRPRKIALEPSHRVRPGTATFLTRVTRWWRAGSLNFEGGAAMNELTLDGDVRSMGEEIAASKLCRRFFAQ